MATTTKRKKKTKYKVSYRKVLYTGLAIILLFVIAPSVYRSVKAFIRTGQIEIHPVKHKRINEFGISIPGGYKIHGIDISHYQKDINWTEVSAIDIKGIKIHFAFIKATEGITRQDRHFERNWNKSKEAGLIRGAYHFYYPTRDAEKQAENFIKQVKLKPGDLPPVLDVEVSKGKSKEDIVAGMKQWCNMVEDHYDVKPIIYTNPNFYNKYLKDDFKDYELWIAHYYEEVPDMDHRDWIFWQHTDCAIIQGIDKPVDLNVFVGNMDDLKNLCLK